MIASIEVRSNSLSPLNNHDYVVIVSPPAGLTPNPLVPGPGRFFRGGHERDIMGKVQGNINKK